MKIFMFSCNVSDEKNKEDTNWCYLDTQEKEDEKIEVSDSNNKEIIEQYFLDEKEIKPQKSPVSPLKLSFKKDSPIFPTTQKSFLLDGEKIEMKIENVACFTNSHDEVVYGDLLITNYQIIFQSRETKPLETSSLVEKLTKNEYSIPHTMIKFCDEMPLGEQEKQYIHASLRLTAKNNRFLQIYFFQDQVLYRAQSLINKLCPIKAKLTFSYLFKTQTKFSSQEIEDGWNIYKPEDEFFKRQNLNLQDWTSQHNLNDQYQLCNSYPKYLVFPRTNKNDIIGSASYRSSGRLPTLTWADPKLNCCLARSSQPCTGIRGSRSKEDEQLLESFTSNSKTKKLYIIDCRPKTNAIANTLMGKGYENSDNYKNSEILFMNVENIHVMNESFNKLSKISIKTDENQYLSGIESSGWLTHISNIILGATKMSNYLNEGNAVLCHCSDGWDRTAQFCTVSQLLLDPYYRTIQGFEVLIEKDWISFGHKFQDRCDHLKKTSQEMSPIFVQFIDCVYHLWQQFPNEFEFNEKFLLSIVEHTYSCLFGNFLFNDERRAEANSKTKNTVSLWTYINSNLKSFKNSLYQPRTKFLKMDFTMKKLSTQVWSTFYLFPGMRPKYQEMMSSIMNNLQRENNEFKMRLLNEKTHRQSLEDELKSTKERLKEYTDIIENGPEEIITEKNDEDFNIISKHTPRGTETIQRLKSNINIIEDHF